MKRHEIKSQLVLHQVTMSDIAKNEQVSVAAVSQCVSGYNTSRRLQEAVAKSINRTPETVFPVEE